MRNIIARSFLYCYSVVISTLIFYIGLSYFYPDFNRGFLYDKIDIWDDFYKYFLWMHLICTPFLMVLCGLLIFFNIHRKSVRLHRLLGKTAAYIALLLFLPSSLLMSFYSFGGAPGIAAFLLLTGLSLMFLIFALKRIKQRNIQQHRLWMTRFYILLLSGVNLRILLWIFGRDLSQGWQYALLSVASWLPFLIVYEIAKNK